MTINQQVRQKTKSRDRETKLKKDTHTQGLDRYKKQRPENRKSRETEKKRKVNKNHKSNMIIWIIVIKVRGSVDTCLRTQNRPTTTPVQKTL